MFTNRSSIIRGSARRKTPKKMCKQIYLSFEMCGCQLRYRLDECDYGRTDPRCRHVRKAVKATHRDYCHYHTRVKARAERARSWYWAARGRHLWPAPPPMSMPVVTEEDLRSGSASWW
ncbi:hypothetical protein DL768_000527 [Monosporascus sp. mg162]|nr:hypothetical protein DL768_000527 [Monosporascus sp. mg162]